MKFKKTLCGLATGLALYGIQSSVAYGNEQPMVPKVEEMQTYQKDLTELKSEIAKLREELDESREPIKHKSELEVTLYGKKGSDFYFGGSYKSEFFPEHFRLTAVRFNGVNANALGFDWYANAYAYGQDIAPLVQIGIGTSYFDKKTENLGSRLEFHLFWRMGFIKKDGFHVLYSIDHWSNAGATKKNSGENTASLVLGAFF